jgi:hypothetical protein
MIIPKKEKLSANELKQVEKIAEDSECLILEIQGRNRCVYAILGDESKEVMFKRIAGLPFIRKVDRIESPYFDFEFNFVLKNITERLLAVILKQFVARLFQRQV